MKKLMLIATIWLIIGNLVSWILFEFSYREIMMKSIFQIEAVVAMLIFFHVLKP